MTENHDSLANISNLLAWSLQDDGTRNIKRFRRAWNARLATCCQAFKMIFYETWPRVATSLDEIHVSLRDENERCNGAMAKLTDKACAKSSKKRKIYLNSNTHTHTCSVKITINKISIVFHAALIKAGG